jgi:hypothetical protein
MSDVRIAMQTKGFEIFDAQLQALETKVAKGIVRKAVRGGAKPTLKQVKINAKTMVGGEMGGLLARHAKIIVFGHQRKGSYGVQIGMKPNVPEFEYWARGSRTIANFSEGIGRRKKTYGKTIGKSYIPAAIEYGHGNARPIPFIRSAWARTKNRDVKEMRRILKYEIEKAVGTRGVVLHGI